MTGEGDLDVGAAGIVMFDSNWQAWSEDVEVAAISIRAVYETLCNRVLWVSKVE